ncbi:MAG: hypothetical protein EP330_01450 [Deltaproteobacteria bacterium]|nr:MAG: hypothetical protein EP330_01450 [Deltaproteobacteria bacterium]
MEMDPVEYVERLHAVVDQLVEPLTDHHASRLQCKRGCFGCCSDGLSVFGVEAELIRRKFPEVLREQPGPEGMCAFLDAEGGCRVYAHRPYVCRTQGLPLRWGYEQDGEVLEGRDICPLNADGKPIEELSPEELWTIGPFEHRLAEAQAAFGACTEACCDREDLRSLFEPPTP